MIAYNLIRNGEHYEPLAFTQGLEAVGYKVKTCINKKPEKGDILLIWNRYGSFEDRAEEFERAGGEVIIAENGYYGKYNGRRLYALSFNQHHHGGSKVEKPIPEFKPYREGKYILICAQRQIGSKLMRNPVDWAYKTANKIKTKLPIKIRKHPGKYPPEIPLSEDLKDAHACVIWSSASGIEALIEGVPVIYDAPRWIGEESAERLSDTDFGNLKYPSQKEGLVNAFSNQWNIDEIKSGEAFRCLKK